MRRIYSSYVIILSICMQLQAAESPATMWVNIFLHGTVGLRANLTFANFIRLIKDDIEHTRFKKIVEETRKDPFFGLAQPMQELGLQKIDMNALTTAAIYAKITDKEMPQEPETSHLYYTFGWSGLLSPSERYKDACIFYDALKLELTKLERLYPHATIKFRLLCYSHGGSVGLNLAAVQRNKYPQDTLRIDELILLGAPIQHETCHLIYEPTFKKVYHLYSRKDYIQKLDCFSCRRFFSRRRFTASWHCDLPDKLVQIEVKVRANRPGSCRHLIDKSPGHAELWYFGWAPSSYRKTFPLYPFPVAVFAPSIIDLVNTYMPQDTHIVVELRPEAGDALLRKRHHFHKICRVPWISIAELAALKELTEPYVPDLLTPEAQEAHIQNAILTVTRCEIPTANQAISIRHIGAYTIP